MFKHNFWVEILQHIFYRHFPKHIFKSTFFKTFFLSRNFPKHIFESKFHKIFVSQNSTNIFLSRFLCQIFFSNHVHPNSEGTHRNDTLFLIMICEFIKHMFVICRIIKKRIAKKNLKACYLFWCLKFLTCSRVYELIYTKICYIYIPINLHIFVF